MKNFLLLLLLTLLISCSSDSENNSNNLNFNLNFDKAFVGDDPNSISLSDRDIKLVLMTSQASIIEGEYVGNGALMSFHFYSSDDDFITPGVYNFNPSSTITEMTYSYGFYVPNIDAVRETFDGDYYYEDNCFIEIAYNSQGQIIVNYELDLYDNNTDEFVKRINGNYTGDYDFIGYDHDLWW